MKIVVTGGEGFLGSHIVDALVARGDDVIAIDHHAREKMRFPNPGARMITSRFGDASIRELLLKEKPDAIVHVAAQISVSKSLKDPLADAQTNILDAVNLLTWAKEAGVKRFIFASSGGAIYGDHPVRPTPLLDNPEPLSPYGIGKLTFEKYLEASQSMGGPSAISLRFSNFYGPRQQISLETGEGNAVTLFLHRMLVSGEPITIFGEGDASRDYLFVDDAADAVLRAIESEVTGPVNVGTGKGASIHELVDILMEIHGQPHVLNYSPYRPGEVYHSIIDSSSAEQKLGWHPRTALKDGLRKTYDWYKATFSK